MISINQLIDFQDSRLIDLIIRFMHLVHSMIFAKSVGQMYDAETA